MLIVIRKWVSQCGPWILPFKTHKSLHHLLPCASGYTSYPDLGKPVTQFRAREASFASRSLRVGCRVHKECCMEGMTLLLLLELDRTLTPSPSRFLTLKGKTIQCQDVLFMVQVIGEYLIFDSWRSHDTFHQLRIWSVGFHDTTTIKNVTVLFLFTFLVRLFLCFQTLWHSWHMSDGSNTVPFCSSSGYSILNWEQTGTFFIFAENNSLINMCTDFFKAIG